MIPKGKYFIIFTALLIAMMSIAVAADVDDSATESITTPAVTQQTTDNIDVQTVTHTNNEINKKVENNIVNETNNEENTRSTTHNLNNNNFDNYITTSGLSSTVNEGDILNFTTDVTRTTSSYIINKPINIIGNGFTLDLNTINGYSDSTNPTYVEFNSGASNSNITNLKFHNTQVFTTTASNITFDNINVTIDNQGVGKGTGYFAMRNGVINITVKNSYFHAANNTGCSAIVITLGENCTIDNNTIIGEGTVGNLVYLNMWGATGNANGITQNKNNVISNNTIIGPETPSSICIGIVVGGPHNHIINNTINYAGTGINGNWAGTYDPATNTTNDYYNDTYVGNGYINNTLNNGASFSGAQNSFIAGNIFTGTATIAKNSNVKYNIFQSDVTLKNNVNFKNNNAENSTVYVNGSNCDLCSDTVNTIVLKDGITNISICLDMDGVNIVGNTSIINWYNHPSSPSSSSSLTKKLFKSVKGEGEPNVIDVTEENYAIYFKNNTYSSYRLSSIITTDTIFNLYYVPENINRIQFNNYDESVAVTFVGKNDLTLRNVLFNLMGGNVIVKDIHLIYEDTNLITNNTYIGLSYLLSGDATPMILDNITVDCSADYDERGLGPLIKKGSANTGQKNIIVRNSVFNVEVPATDGYSVITGSGISFINNSITIEETYGVGDSPRLTAMDLTAESGVSIVVEGNNITVLAEDDACGIKFQESVANSNITNNRITVTSTEATATGVQLTGNDNIVTGNYIIANDKKGDEAVTATGENNVVQDNTPVAPKIIDYYVSDADGSDENDGSESSPFKTVQAALDNTDENDIFNIHILEGTYKGEGNTNLTIPGDYNINFIGSGINRTIFDGEAQFTVPGEGSVWGGTGIWNSWTNTSGNWMMNITEGTGRITITDLTIQNSWSPSGSSIKLTQPTIDNRATLEVSNVYFYKNHAGLGAGIKNNDGATLYVDNCIFENNTKSSTTGNYGAAVYNNGTAVMTNTQIVRNYARWGSVTNDKNMTLINCTFEGNIAYDASSGYKNGPSFAADTGITNYFNMYAVYNLTSTIVNCTFQDNQQCDISNGRGDLLLEGCTFNHSTGVYLFPNTNRLITYIPTQDIRNNTFVDMQPSTVFATMISSTTPSVGVRVLSGYDLTIENNTFDVGCTDYSYGIYLTANATVKNNILTDYIYVNGANNTIINNTINTTKENTIALANAAKDTQIIDNTLLGGYTVGDLSVKNILPTTVLENNKPAVSTYVINDDNYATFFDENSVLRTSIVANGSLIIFVENLTNKVFVFDNVKVAVDVNTTLYNATIVTQNNARVLFNNLKIDNEGTDEDYVILLESEGNTIKNANIHVVTDKAVQIIKIEEDGNIITGSTINATIPSADVKWNSAWTMGNAPSAGIFIRSSNNKVNSTKLYLYSPTSVSGSTYPTVDGIDIQSKDVGEYVTGNEIRSSRINVTGGSYVYGLNIARAKDTITPLSYFDVTSTSYAAAIQIGDADNNTISGYIYAKADDTAYGFYSTAMSSGITNNTNASKLYIQNIQAPNAVGVRLEGASNFQTGNATFNINGEKVTGIEAVPDYYGNTPDNIYIYALTMNLNGENDTSSMVNVKDSSNVFINRTTFKSTSGKGILLDNTTDSTVTNNYINVANIIGGNAAVESDLENTIYNNTPTIAILTDETYPNFFDENSTLYVDVDIITLGGDLHNKELIFSNHTKVINITNADDYTMYNSTFIIAGNGTYGDRYGFTVDGINFNNTDKPVFIDRFNGTGQKNVKFVNDNIYVTGEDIVAFDAYNNESYIYLDISNSNITMDGKNIVAINYAGYNRGQPGYVSKNNFNLKATNFAIVYNAKDAATQFNNNNVVVNSVFALVANYVNSTISYSNFEENVIDITASEAGVLYFTKGDTYPAYISDNEIKVKTEDPSTLIRIEGPKTVYVEDNVIILDAYNGEKPVITVDCPSAYVRDNYILAKDVRGNDAVNDTGITISNNRPGSVITDDTYDDFFDDMGVLIPLFNNTDLAISGDFVENTIFIFDGVNVTVTSDGTAKIYDGQVMTGNNATVVFNGWEFINSMDAFVLESESNVINNTIINIESEDSIHAIYVYEDKNTIANTKINIVAPSADVEYNDDYTTKAPAPAAIVISSDNNLIDNVSVTFDAPESTGNFPTVDGIYVVSESTPVVNNTIKDTNVTVSGKKYAYGINVGNAKDTTIENVNVEVESEYYADAIQLFDADTITITGTAKATAGSEAYGVYSTAMGYGISQNIDLTGLDITVDAPKATGVLVEGASNIMIADATYDIKGDQATAVNAHVDWMKNIPTNITVTGLDISIDTTGDANLLYFGNASDVTITDNHIEANAGSAINFNATPNAVVTDNYILVGEMLETGIFGNYAVITTEDDTVVENNTPTSKVIDDLNDKISELEDLLGNLTKAKETTITIDPLENVRYGDEITITGTLVNEDSLSLSNQEVTIVFNDEEVTVKTRNGEFTYATTAAIVGENTITVTYAGSDKYLGSDAEYTFEVAKADTIINLTDIEDVKKGETAAIGGILYDHNGNALANKVVRLLINNGRKTVKTNDMGEFSFDYTTTKVGEMTLTATFEGDDLYEATTTETAFEVKALSTVITIDPMDTIIKGTQATITGTLTDENGNAIANAQVRITINGSPKTLKTDSEGRFTHTYTMGQVGENTITATYAGSVNYEAAECETTVEVAKAQPVITIDPIESVNLGESATITGTLTDADGNAIANAQVKVFVNGSPKTLKTDANGAFTHTFKMTKEGTNNITATFNGNNDFELAEATSTVEVIKAE